MLNRLSNAAASGRGTVRDVQPQRRGLAGAVYLLAALLTLLAAPAARAQIEQPEIPVDEKIGFTYVRPISRMLNPASKPGIRWSNPLVHGSRVAASMGSRAVRIYLEKNVQNRYTLGGQDHEFNLPFDPRKQHPLYESHPFVPIEETQNLLDVVRRKPYDGLFRMPEIDTFLMTMYTFAEEEYFYARNSGGVLDDYYFDIAKEMSSVVRYLRITYPDKVFIVTEWEGDWKMKDMIGDYAVPATSEQVWEWVWFHRARLNGVDEGRKHAQEYAGGEGGVYYVPELNDYYAQEFVGHDHQAMGVARILEEDGGSTTSWVDGTRIRPDGYSLSLWQITEHSKTQDLASELKAKVVEAAGYIGIPTSRFIVGEMGLPAKNQVPEADQRLRLAVGALRELGIQNIYYWTLMDKDVHDNDLVHPDAGYGVLGVDGKPLIEAQTIFSMNSGRYDFSAHDPKVGALTGQRAGRTVEYYGFTVELENTGNLHWDPYVGVWLRVTLRQRGSAAIILRQDVLIDQGGPSVAPGEFYTARLLIPKDKVTPGFFSVTWEMHHMYWDTFGRRWDWEFALPEELPPASQPSRGGGRGTRGGRGPQRAN
jgi:hypothetical protein